MPSNRLQDKTAIITGASRRIGIGAAIARHFASEGATLVLTTYHAYDHAMPWGGDPLEVLQLRDELQSSGATCITIDIDLSQPQAPQQLFEDILARSGPVDILVNNATYSVDLDILALTSAEIDAHFNLNARGMMLLCQAFVRQWQHHPTQKDGRIINLTSGQGAGPMPGNLAYVASKGAVDAFTVSLATEIAAQNITVNAVDPGITDTGWIPPNLKKHWEDIAPLGRVGQPDDAARLVTFLASAEASWITGQIIRSRGGL